MIDLTKPVQTRDGREVDLYNKERMHGAVKDSDGTWCLWKWHQDGDSVSPLDRSYDLVNVPPKMIKRRLYISTWGDAGWRADNEALNKKHFGGVNLTAFNFPVDIEIPEGYGL